MMDVERLSKAQREASPEPFARFLGEGSGAVAALWVRADTVYRRLGLDCWDLARDARNYPGPGPIIAHPPCGPWGRYAHRCKYQQRGDGLIALELVHRYGGVVEQPASSSLFDHACCCGMLQYVEQRAFGHPALKATLLYWHPAPSPRHE